MAYLTLIWKNTKEMTKDCQLMRLVTRLIFIWFYTVVYEIDRGNAIFKLVIWSSIFVREFNVVSVPDSGLEKQVYSVDNTKTKQSNSTRYTKTAASPHTAVLPSHLYRALLLICVYEINFRYIFIIDQYSTSELRNNTPVLPDPFEYISSTPH